MNSSSTRPPISVVLPTLNRAGTLPRAIRSVLAQTLAVDELIVVDDGSTEDIGAVVRSFGDSRLRHLRRDSRGGAASARNLGISAARNEWIAFQDSDDEWVADKLEKQWALLSRSPAQVGLVCCAYRIVQGVGPDKVYRPTAAMGSGRWPAAALYEFPFITPTWLARRDALRAAGLFDESMPNLEDWELAFRLYAVTEFRVVDEPLVIKHSSSDSLDGDTRKRLVSFRRIAGQHGHLWRECPQVLARHYHELGRLELRFGSAAEARRLLWQALKWNPKARTAALLSLALLGQRPYLALSRLRHPQTAQLLVPEKTVHP